MQPFQFEPNQSGRPVVCDGLTVAYLEPDVDASFGYTMAAAQELLDVALSLRAICGRQANILSTATDAERRDLLNRVYDLINGAGNDAIAKATGDAL